MIEVRQLHKSFGRNKILEDVSFRIERGESVVIIGRSGGGKSVLLKHLIALLKPDAGEVWVEGEDIVPLNERELLRVRRKFGMLFQGAALFDSMTVAENVAFAFRRDRSLPEGEIARWSFERAASHYLRTAAAMRLRANSLKKEAAFLVRPTKIFGGVACERRSGPASPPRCAWWTGSSWGRRPRRTARSSTATRRAPRSPPPRSSRR